MGAAPRYLPAEPWVGGLSGWGHSPEARPLRRDEREPSRISPIAACRVSHLHCRAGGARGHVCTGEVHGGPQRWTKGRLRGWHGARVSGAGARGLWLLLFLPGSAGLAALLAPSSSNQVPASRPFCRLFGFSRLLLVCAVGGRISGQSRSCLALCLLTVSQELREVAQYCQLCSEFPASVARAVKSGSAAFQGFGEGGGILKSASLRFPPPEL